MRYPEVEASSNMRLIDISVLLLFTIPALGQQQQQPSSEDNLYSLEKEAALGTALAADFRHRVPSVDDADLCAYVTKVVARLNEFAQSPFRITVEISGSTDLKPDTVGLPGGYLFVPMRLLASAQDEAELARPVAHAMAHIATRQATRQATRGQIVNLATVPLIFIGGWAHDDGTKMPLGFRKFQEEHEAQADRLAAEWVKRSGFADGTFETGEFATMRDRARVVAPPAPKNPEPLSLRKRRP
jgi:beta-barrel assembly-enhancing protease